MTNFILADNQELTAFALKTLIREHESATLHNATDKEQLVKQLQAEEEQHAKVLTHTEIEILRGVAQGKNIVTSHHLFGNTLALVTNTLLRFGVKPRLRDLTNLQAVEDAIDEE